MAGILDNKSRVIDAFITQEGRRQIAAGELRVRYMTFSDSDVYYTADGDVASDVTNRLYFEPSNLPQDQIVFEADDAGRLKPFAASSDLAIAAGQLSYSSVSLNDELDMLDETTVLTGDVFASTMKELLKSSIDNFEKLRIIGSYDELFGEKDFAIGPSGVTFTLTEGSEAKCRTNDMQSLFADPRMSQVDNFTYLPPLNRPGVGETSATPIGDYPAWSRPLSKGQAFEALFTELDFFQRDGKMRTLSFDPTSVDNNVICQVFEIGKDAATKLDALHFGKDTRGDVFFLGKIVLDDNDAQSFVHIFTLVFQ